MNSVCFSGKYYVKSIYVGTHAVHIHAYKDELMI